MNENKELSESISVESIKQIGKTNVATRIKQCIWIISVIGITIFACVYFNNPKFLWLLLLLLGAF